MKYQYLFLIVVILLLTGIVFADVTIKGDNMYFETTQEIEINAARIKLPGINPAQEQIIGNAPVLSFDKNTNESIYTLRHIVPDYKGGSDWFVAFYWAPDGTSVGNVSWCVEGTPLFYNNNELLTEVGSATCISSSSLGNLNEVIKSDLLLINGTSFVEDGTVPIRIYRGASLAEDNYDGDSHLIEATIYYTSVNLGD